MNSGEKFFLEKKEESFEIAREDFRRGREQRGRAGFFLFCFK